MFYGITDLTAFIIGTLIIVVLPGPNSFYVMLAASRFGFGAGCRGAAGVFMGDLILMVLAAAGLASVFHTHPLLFLALKYAGAAYLAYLGVGLIRAALARWLRKEVKTAEPLPDALSAPPLSVSQVRSRPFRTALGISLMNPKAILFYVSFFIQFVSPGYEHPALSFLILGTIVQLCSMTYLFILIVGGAFLADALRQRRRLSAAATGGIGGLFIGFAAKLAGG